MAAGFLKIFPVHRGNAFTGSDGINYILLNGLSYARTAYPDLSLLWPSGAYGSDDTNMHMPDLTDLELRAWSSAGYFDPGVEARTALSGTLPVGSGMGSFQDAEMQVHTHLDSQAGAGGRSTGNNPNRNAAINSSSVDSTGITIEGSGSVGAADSNALKLAHTKVYFYIAAS